MAENAFENTDSTGADGREAAEESSLESAVDDGDDLEDGTSDDDDRDEDPSDAQLQQEERAGDPTTDDVSFEVDGDGEDTEDDGIEPGAEGAYGTGIEGADQILEEERVRNEGTEAEEWGDFEDADGRDDSAAAEQGNRDEDEMVSGGDSRETAELGGDDLDVDAVAESDDPDDEVRLAGGLDVDGEGADASGAVLGEDPLAGGPTGR